jgi:hypothetical protein
MGRGLWLRLRLYLCRWVGWSWRELWRGLLLRAEPSLLIRLLGRLIRLLLLVTLLSVALLVIRRLVSLLEALLVHGLTVALLLIALLGWRLERYGLVALRRGAGGSAGNGRGIHRSVAVVERTHHAVAVVRVDGPGEGRRVARWGARGDLLDWRLRRCGVNASADDGGRRFGLGAVAQEEEDTSTNKSNCTCEG